MREGSESDWNAAGGRPSGQTRRLGRRPAPGKLVSSEGVGLARAEPGFLARLLPARTRSARLEPEF